MDMLLPDFSLGMYQLFSQESPNLSLREPYNTPWPVIQKQELSRSVNASLCKKHHHESSLPSSIDGTRHVSMLYLFVKTSSMSWRLLVVRPWCSLLIFYLLTLLLRTLITYTELTSVPLRSTIYSHCSCWPPSQNLPPSVFDAALYHYLYHNKKHLAALYGLAVPDLTLLVSFPPLIPLQVLPCSCNMALICYILNGFLSVLEGVFPKW